MTEQELRLKTAETEKKSHLDYFNTAVSVDCVIFGYDRKELKVLLIKSDLENSGNYIPCWATWCARMKTLNLLLTVFKKQNRAG